MLKLDSQAQQLFSLLDLTSLNEADTPETIADLCTRAATTTGHVAAVCVYPQFIPLVKEYLGPESPIKIATVANFPSGTLSLTETLASIQMSLQAGATEIDVVFPYHDFLNGKQEAAKTFIQACRAACPAPIVLKVILETGVLNDPVAIREASRDVLYAGADFIKTSTGKVAQGATLAAARAMLEIIAELTPILNRSLGFKASGGIRTFVQAAEYLQLAAAILGKEWVQPTTFRIGTSRLT